MTQSIHARILHVTPILVGLPSPAPSVFRNKFKVLVYISYICQNTHPSFNSRYLRSCDQGLLMVPRTRLKNKGVIGLHLDSGMLFLQTEEPSKNSFKRPLKKLLFEANFRWFPPLFLVLICWSPVALCVVDVHAVYDVLSFDIFYFFLLTL